MDSLTFYEKFTSVALIMQAAALGKVWLDTRRQRKQISALNGVIITLSSLMGRLYGFKDAVKRCHVRQCPFRGEADAMTSPLPDLEKMMEGVERAES